MIVGNYFNALANDLIAIAYLPWVCLSARSSTALAIYTSEFPPPYITNLFLIKVVNTHKASCKDLSASSKIC